MEAQPLTLPEIKIKKDELSKKIADLVRAFEREVGFNAEVEIVRLEVGACGSPSLYCQVNIRI